MRFTDSHCHLDFDEFNTSYDQLLSECASYNIHQIIIPSVSPDNWKKVLALSTLNDKKISLNQNSAALITRCFPALGIHPWFLRHLSISALESLEKEVSKHRNKIVAIGETGIDHPIAVHQNNLSQQIEFFDIQIRLADSQKLPLIVHHRKSHSLIIKQLKASKFKLGGIIHAFSGSYEQAKQYIDLDFKLGVGGTITYPRAQKTIKAVSRLPIDSIVLETDAPAMPLHGFQGTVNTPIRVVDVFKQLCKIRNENEQTLAQGLENNIQDFLKRSK